MLSVLRRPVAACALLLAAYVGLSLFNDPRGYLGTDTGGKVATLRVMEQHGRLDPDLGYWAERWDPEGQVHPLYYTSKVGDRWVNATTLPMLYAGYPLYRLGGYRLALLLPMLGSVLGALAARALARRLSATDGWAAFWIVGLASPLTIYALDFWEHSLGVAAMAWAVVVLVDVLRGDRSPPWAFAAGALFGAAATLRNEALVYGLVAVAGTCLVVWLARRQFAAAVVAGTLATVGLAVPLLANESLERVTVGQAIRTGRVTGTASSAFSGDAERSKRVEEAMLNAAAITPRQEPSSYLVGFALLALLAYVAVRSSRAGDAGPAVIAVVGAGALYLIRFGYGFGFVPGMIAATPLAAVGLALGWGSLTGRYALGVGLAALPLVWATQFLGGAAPQWAGRYTLLTGLLLGVAGIVVLPRMRVWAQRALVGMAIVVTAFGLAWTSIRTNGFGSGLAELNRRTEPVLISRIGHLAREGGAFYGDRRWLTAPSDRDHERAVDVLEQAGIRRFALVDLEKAGSRPVPAGWREAGRAEVELLDGIRLQVTTYESS